MIAPVATPAHYPTDGARRADLAIHLVGLALLLIGGATLMSLSSGAGRTSALAVYATGFVLMMTFSLAYNFSNELRRPFLRRLDHVGIFLMIAGSYTPFTTQVLTAGWAWGMTIGVWSIDPARSWRSGLHDRCSVLRHRALALLAAHLACARGRRGQRPLGCDIPRDGPTGGDLTPFRSID